MKKIYILGLLLLLLISCVDEDPKLVNPPPPFLSIRIRLLNAINNEDNIGWGFNNSPYSNSVKYLELTNSQMPPPYDSLALEFYQNNKLTYTSNRKFRLVRETRYLIIAGKSLGEVSHVDTFMILSTTYGLPTKLGNAYFKFVNLIRDSNLSATLIDGCPNGRPLVSNVTYFAYPFLQTVPYGNYTLSVVLNDGVKSGLLNTYSVNFSEDGEYTLFLAKKRDGTIGLYLYDDYDTTKGLVELLPIPERVSYLRTVNLSSENISLYRFPNQVLNEDIPQNWSTKYHSISACENDYLDSIEIRSSNSNNILGYSFEVFKRYTLLVFDSTENKKKLILVPPAKLRESTNGRSIIRVVNAVDTNFAITFSVGTRNSKNINGYVSGEVIAANLKSNKVSNTVSIEPGYLPLTIFSATEPAFLLKSTYTEIAADYAYLIVLYKSSDGELKVSLIPEDKEDFIAIQLETGCFVQVLNAFPDATSLKISFPKYLQNIKINYKECFATVLPTSVDGIYYDGNQKEIVLDPFKTGLFVFSGLNPEIDLFDISIPSMGKETNSYRRRFFNASKEIENVGIFHDSSKQKIVLNELNYGQYSSVERLFLERKFSLVYFDNKKNKVISQFNDIFLSFGKNYTLVFSGNKSKSFSLIVVQEY